MQRGSAETTHRQNSAQHQPDNSAEFLQGSVLFKPGHNCWRVERATHASMLVDCANYYRALHESICKARHSVFVLGWDIDSRIELLRGKDAEQAQQRGCPVKFFDLIQWKARQHPQVMIYLNRWDYSLFMAAERENFSEFKWKWESPDNVFYRFDDQLPLGASHHQKIVVVDDEIAYCGGMDVSMGRWDHRQHRTRNKNRVDPVGTLKTGHDHPFGPYHDVQIVVAGPAARALAHIARERWYKASEIVAIPMRTEHEDAEAEAGLNTPPSTALPATWPQLENTDFHNVDIAIALTLPQFKAQAQVQQIEQLYLDMIGRAEHFIYMENQFFTQQAVARALNKRLREKPQLQVLLLSCWNPEGIMERKSMWYGRVLFRDLLEAGGVQNRVVLAYPISREHDAHSTVANLNVGYGTSTKEKAAHEQGLQKPVRIHSKLMIVDDQYLRVGSSNINNRSMALDSECDLVLQAAYGEQGEESRLKIAAIRNDLIREHTGREIEDIAQLIEHGQAQTFLQEEPGSTQHLRRINDEQYRHERFTAFAIRFADPVKPILPPRLTSRKRLRNAGRHIGEESSMPTRLIFAVLLILGLVLAWKVTPLADYADPDKLVPWLQAVRNTPWALPAALAVYVVATLLFFPHVIMTATVVLVFAPIEAFGVAMLGSLISGAIGFTLGRQMGQKSLHALVGNFAGKIAHYANRGGIIGITLLRMLPVAPYTVVNLALGMMQVPFKTFMIATLLGMLPGTLVSAYLGHSVVELFQNPNSENLLYLAAGLLAWIGVIVATHFVAKRWQPANNSPASHTHFKEDRAQEDEHSAAHKTESKTA